MDHDAGVGGGREGEGVGGRVETEGGAEGGMVNLELVEGVLEILEFRGSGE